MQRFDNLRAELAKLPQEAKPLKPSKPSHRLNLEAVRNWATSLSLEDHAQWLDNLLERGSERSKEPHAKQEALALKLEQEAQTVLEQVVQALKQEHEARQAEAELEQALKREQEARQAQAELEQVAQALAQVLRGAEVMTFAESDQAWRATQAQDRLVGTAATEPGARCSTPRGTPSGR